MNSELLSLIDSHVQYFCNYINCSLTYTKTKNYSGPSLTIFLSKRKCWHKHSYKEKENYLKTTYYEDEKHISFKIGETHMEKYNQLLIKQEKNIIMQSDAQLKYEYEKMYIKTCQELFVVEEANDEQLNEAYSDMIEYLQFDIANLKTQYNESSNTYKSKLDELKTYHQNEIEDVLRLIRDHNDIEIYKLKERIEMCESTYKEEVERRQYHAMIM